MSSRQLQTTLHLNHLYTFRGYESKTLRWTPDTRLFKELLESINHLEFKSPTRDKQRDLLFANTALKFSWARA